MISERPFADGRHTAVFVFNELRVDGGRLTQLWLARLRAFDEAGWATHAALINKDARLDRTVTRLVASGRLPAGTAIHHYAMRDRRIRASWWAPLEPGASIDPRVGDWLDWLTGQIPGAVVFADSPAAYPYLAHMTNPLVARVAGIHLNHLARPKRAEDPGAARHPGAQADTHPHRDPADGPWAARFGERFAPIHGQFDALVVMSRAQAADLRTRLGADLPVVVIPPGVPRAARPGLADSAQPAVLSVPDLAPAEPRIVSAGPLETAAGHADVIRALHALSADHRDLRLDIVGSGPSEDAARAHAAELAALAEQLGMADRVSVLPPGSDERSALPGAALLVWAGRRESYPLAIVRALGQGIPVVARNVRYGPSEAITAAVLGELVEDGEDLAAALSRGLAAPREPEKVLAAAEQLLRQTDPAAVAAAWIGLATSLADRVCDHSSPSLLVESVNTLSRILRLPGVLADSAAPLSRWSCELPGLVEPAGWLADPPRPPGEDPVEDDDDAPVHPHAAGPTRETVAQLRSNALAFVATQTGAPFRVEFSDGTHVTPLLATGFTERVIASRAGNAMLRREPDGTVWVSPRPELLFASNVDGRVLVRAAADDPPSDVTHALEWAVDIDWGQVRATTRGASFRGTLRATGIAPADDSPPAICVTDVGGFSRAVGLLHYTGTARIDGLAWSAPVDGLLETAPLVRTVALAGGALPLHVGYRGLLVPIGGLWTVGRREPLHLDCELGSITLLPSPGGRVLAAPGRGYRARVSGAVRVALRRG